jgi:hypothetical protein
MSKNKHQLKKIIHSLERANLIPEFDKENHYQTSQVATWSWAGRIRWFEPHPRHGNMYTTYHPAHAKRPLRVVCLALAGFPYR